MFIETFDSVLSSDECNEFKHEIRNKSKTVVFTTVANFKNDKFTDAALAMRLFKTIPEAITNGMRPHNVVMTGMYSPDDEFGLHVDTGLYYNPELEEKCNFTYIIYLNDDLTGGETAFYDDSLLLKRTINPKRGMGLLFDLSIWHKANKVFTGEKYWIGIEIISKFKKEEKI